MDAKKTMILGAVFLLVGIVMLSFPGWRHAAVVVLGGAVALLLLLAGALFVFMGFVQAKEDRANTEKERQEAARRAAMAAEAS